MASKHGDSFVGSGQPADRTLFALIVALATTLQCVAAFHVGGLFRDEVNSLNLASFPTLGEMLAHNHYDSFPVVYPVVLRGWVALGMGDADWKLRIFCALTGCALLAATARCGWLLTGRLPILSVALLGLTPTTFRFANGLRAYELGAVAMLLVLGATWSLVRRTDLQRSAALLLATLLAVQTLFVNAFMVLAIFVTGGVICLRRSNRRGLAVLALVGIASALSLLPYVAAFRSHSRWSHLLRKDFDVAWISSRFAEALTKGTSFPWSPVVWAAIVVAAALACRAMLVRRRDSGGEPREVAVFAAVLLAAGVLCQLAFVRFLSVPTNVWYYVPVLVLAAVACDAIFNSFPRGKRGDAIYLASAAAVVLLASPDAWRAAHSKVTNYDAMAQQVGAIAASDDYVIVHPWYAGLTFHRYYDGSAPWTELPDVSRDFHDFGPLLQKMGEAHPIDSILARADETLRRGKRVFVVGHLAPLAKGEEPGDLPPSTDEGRTGPRDEDYVRVWLRQLTSFLRARAENTQLLQIAIGAPVMSWENGNVFIFQGYRAPDATRPDPAPARTDR